MSSQITKIDSAARLTDCLQQLIRSAGEWSIIVQINKIAKFFFHFIIIYGSTQCIAKYQTLENESKKAHFYTCQMNFFKISATTF